MRVEAVEKLVQLDGEVPEDPLQLEAEIIRGAIEHRDRLPNPHPGEILLEDFLKPMRITQSELARALGVPPRRINEIVLGKRAVTAETDLLLTRYFGLSEGLFLRLQATYDLENARLSLRDRLTAVRPRDAA